MPSIRVVSWNVNARRDCAGQVAALVAFEPDVVALQEVTAGSDARFPECLAAAGLPHYVSGAALAAEAGAETIAKRYSALASQYPFVVEPVPGLPRPELAISALVGAPGGPVRVLGVHIPTWSNGSQAKMQTQEGVCAYLAARDGPTILMGDFNSPKQELEDGTIVPFMRPKDVRGRAAELGLMTACLRDGALVDCFRSANGLGASGESWYWKNRGRTGGFRLDHIFASPHFRTVSCRYAHELRLAGMSDHSPILAELESR
jgi:endonuclease/exonuclease/phosphatase family metal-dependent hydrolase